MPTSALCFVMCLIEAVTAPAAMPAPVAPPGEQVRSATEHEPSRWGVEIGPLWLAVGNFLRPKLTLTAWRRGERTGEVLIAPLLRLPQNLDDGEIFEVGGELGYRQTLWRGLAVELSALVLRSRVDSAIDGRRYVGMNVFIASAIGWRIDLQLRRARLYVLPQIGAGRDVVRTDPPPTPGGLHIRLVGELLFGMRF